MASIAISLAACAPINGGTNSAAQANSAQASAQRAEAAAMQMPAYAKAVAAEEQASQAPRDPGGLIKSMVQITAADRMAVKAGLAPVGILTYDTELLDMVAKHPATLQEHERNHAWAKRKHALFAARDAALKAHTAAVVKKNQQEQQFYSGMANALGNGKPNPCLSPSGQNTCAAQSPSRQGGGSSVQYTAGPNGLGATMGNLTIGPGGIGAGF